MKFSIKNFFSKRDQIRRKLSIWLNLLKKSLIENFTFYAVLEKAVISDILGFFEIMVLLIHIPSQHRYLQYSV